MKKFTLHKLIKSITMLMLMLLFSGAGIAQKVPVLKSSSPNSVAMSSKAPAGSSVLYSQVDLATTGWASQDFEAGYNFYDCEGADDFVVPSGGWEIAAIDVYGTGAPGPFNLVNVMFYNDAGGLPNATAFSTFAGVTAVDNGSGNLSITLPSGGINLPAGHYWMSVQDAEPYVTNGQWFWTKNTVIYNTICHWRNPDDGFVTGATTWTGVDIAFGESYDFAFVLYGPAPVPLSNWAIYIGIFLIAMFMFVGYRRRLFA